MRARRCEVCAPKMRKGGEGSVVCDVGGEMEVKRRKVLDQKETEKCSHGCQS